MGPGNDFVSDHPRGASSSLVFLGNHYPPHACSAPALPSWRHLPPCPRLTARPLYVVLDLIDPGQPGEDGGRIRVRLDADRAILMGDVYRTICRTACRFWATNTPRTVRLRSKLSPSVRLCQTCPIAVIRHDHGRTWRIRTRVFAAGGCVEGHGDGVASEPGAGHFAEKSESSGKTSGSLVRGQIGKVQFRVGGGAWSDWGG